MNHKKAHRGIGLWIVGLLFWIGCPPLHADKVILKDGTIYEGAIVDETKKDVLIRTYGYDAKLLLLEDREILTVIHERPKSAPRDPTRYVLIEALGSGQFFADDLALGPAAGLHLGGGVRIHPLVEIDAGFDWTPSLSGELLVVDKQISRGYQQFLSYRYGFLFKFFPFFTKKNRQTEPYGIVGYQWNRLIPKGSGDTLIGGGWQAGLGLQHRLVKAVFLEVRAIYQGGAYSKINFLGNDRDFQNNIRHNTYTLSTGLSYHW